VGSDPAELDGTNRIDRLDVDGSQVVLAKADAVAAELELERISEQASAQDRDGGAGNEPELAKSPRDPAVDGRENTAAKSGGLRRQG